MPRPRSGGSDYSDADADGMAEREMEYTKLQRQHRIMQGDREAYTEESQNLIRKQKAEISQLEAERAELLKDLRLAESRSNQNKDEVHTDKLTTLVNDRDDLHQSIDDEKENQKELDAKIREWEKKIRDQHKNMGGIHMSRQHTIKTQKNVRVLENRLDKENQKFNNCLTANASLREEIDSLRVERVRFDNLYCKLDKERMELRRDLGEVIDQSSQAYDSRDECQAKMILLKEKADKDLQQHNAEMKELVRIIDHDRKLKEFMGIKGQERQEDPQLVAWRSRKESLEAERKKEFAEDSVEAYEAAFERIKEITGEEDLDLLVEKFIEVEDRNFALFNYVNEQNNEIETLQEQIAEMKDEIANFKEQGVEMETQRQAILSNLEEKQVTASKNADEHDEKHTAIMKILDQLRAGIDSLFNKISCERSAIDDMLGAQTGVQDRNMIQYLGIIEQRTNELLSIQNYSNSKDYEKYDPKAGGLLGAGPQATQNQMQIMAPSVGDEYESEGSEASDDDRPFTRNELQSKVMKTVKKRESAMRREGFKYDLSNAREKTQKKKK
ncbi:unnamed protein product [Owenia fusiformis]|uniref:Uncharacterized protein n=1 Tax=Owenia fusiformis TaxID=6347 RepID=A0A8J1TQX0_OWEFU|nr:unnamed protein product [Owenia fusiformis]